MAAPWERQPGESSKAHAAFVVYRDLGPTRTLLRVADQVGKSNTLVSRWSHRDGWVARAAAWDTEQDLARRVELAAARAEVDARALRIANSVQAALVARLAAIDPATLTPRQLRYWMTVCTAVQQQAGMRLAADLPLVKHHVRVRAIADAVTRRVASNPDRVPLGGHP